MTCHAHATNPFHRAPTAPKKIILSGPVCLPKQRCAYLPTCLCPCTFLNSRNRSRTTYTPNRTCLPYLNNSPDSSTHPSIRLSTTGSIGNLQVSKATTNTKNTPPAGCRPFLPPEPQKIRVRFTDDGGQEHGFRAVPLPLAPCQKSQQHPARSSRWGGGVRYVIFLPAFFPLLTPSPPSPPRLRFPGCVRFPGKPRDGMECRSNRREQGGYV